MASKDGFPSIRELATYLRDTFEVDRIPEPYDVRLQVVDGSWYVATGDPSYDTDHRGYWGASMFPAYPKRFNSRDMARDLIEQAREDKAQDF